MESHYHHGHYPGGALPYGAAYHHQRIKIKVVGTYTTRLLRFIVSEFQSFSLTIAKFFSMGITVIRHGTKGSLARLSAGLRECGGAA